ncbi:MAG: 30S ribosomal protein S17 [Methanobacteriota archaeon]|nr:MAG: 30S ribosomal protein S17 [Euryarchaeota archaeon]
MPRKKKVQSRDIGIDVPAPEESCQDVKCPFHGKLSVRGQIIEGVVVSDKMDNTVVVARERLRFVPKYERYEKRTSRHHAHSPPCIAAKTGDHVTMIECRPLAKTVSYVVIQKK